MKKQTPLSKLKTLFRVKKNHRILEFKQSLFLKSYFERNIESAKTS